MSWIKIIDYKKSSGKLKKLYDRVKGPNNSIDEVLSIHSLRPHTLEGHMALYKSVLHHNSNSMPKWYLELLGTYVSELNHCSYCVAHHSVGLKKGLDNDKKYQLIIKALTSGHFDNILNEKQIEGVRYAKNLTLNHSNIRKEDIQKLRSKGFSDGEVLEVNQVVCYFNYVNRMVIGLGVSLEKNNIGLTPKIGESDDWSHQ
ncbi:MAG: peroxidase-related enzyme [Saprospiraceae bacterium]